MSSNSSDRILIRGDRLRAEREKRGWSQHALGKMLGFGVNQINRYEVGANDPSSSVLGLLAQTLNVTTDYLLGLSDVPQSYAAETLRPEERDLLDAFNAGDTTTVVLLLAERVRQLGGDGDKG